MRVNSSIYKKCLYFKIWLNIGMASIIYLSKIHQKNNRVIEFHVDQKL